jgi:hypothetical protein
VDFSAEMEHINSFTQQEQVEKISFKNFDSKWGCSNLNGVIDEPQILWPRT